jgi:ribosomal protein L18E
MDSEQYTLQSDISSEDALDVERNIQNQLEESKNTFQTGVIQSPKVLKCIIEDIDRNEETYVSEVSVSYDGKKIKLINEQIENKFQEGDTVYVPAYILKYGNIRHKVVSKQIYSKDRANSIVKYLKNEYVLGDSDFRFKFHSDTDFKCNYRNNILAEKIDTHETTFSWVINSLAFILSYSIMIYLTSRNIFIFLTSYLITIFMMYMTISIISGNTHMPTKFGKYKVSTLSKNKIENAECDDINKEYKVIVLNITRSSEGLHAKSPKLDCEWFFTRSKRGVLSDEGQKFIENLPSNGNKCVVSVNNYGNNNSEFKSNCGKWWIDVDSI